MGFKYINAGYPRLYGYDVNAATNTTRNPVNGLCYYGAMSTTIDFPSNCNEIWAKCDFFRTGKGWYLEVGVGNYLSSQTERTASSPLYGYLQKDYKQYVHCGEGLISLSGATDIQNSKTYSVLVHSKNGQNGCLEVYVDGEEMYSYSGVVAWAAHKISLKNADGNASVHNIIISDTEIGLTEQVYVIPAKTTETTMTNNNGTYTATEENQILKQTLDTDTLITKANSSNLRITGIGMYSKGRFNGEGLTKLALLQGNTEKGEVNLKSSDYEYGVSWDANMSIEQLAATELSWKAKA